MILTITWITIGIFSLWTLKRLRYGLFRVFNFSCETIEHGVWSVVILALGLILWPGVIVVSAIKEG